MSRSPERRGLASKLNSVAARTIFVMLLGIGVVHLLSLWTYQSALKNEVEASNVGRLADRLITIKRAVLRSPLEEREQVAHDLSGGPIEAHWSRSEHAVPGGPGAKTWDELGATLRRLAPELAEDSLIIGANRRSADDPHLALISMRLADDSWVNVSLVSWSPRVGGEHGTLLSTTLMAVGAIIVSFLLVRWLTLPLSAFSEAANRFYHSREIVSIPERGPNEIRELAAAFNDMQRRIVGLIESRTQALAAVSHDLKTPITRLRFRAEDIADIQVRTSIARDLDEMERMIDQTLTYLRGDRLEEEIKPIDLVAILESVCDDLVDAGGVVEFEGPASAILSGRRLALKRAFANLMHNAVKYGQRARAKVVESTGAVSVLIEDDGPGIRPEDRERALQPFVRLEPSRNPETGGFGLGLAIAQAIIAGHGGTLELSNGPVRGLVVRVMLPKATPSD